MTVNNNITKGTTTVAPAVSNPIVAAPKYGKYERFVKELVVPELDIINQNIDEYNDISSKALEFNVMPKLLEKVIRLKQYELKDFLYSVLKGHGYEVMYEDGYLFAKGNVPVMLCAHMDTVHKEPVKTIWMSDTGMIWSPQGIGGDDRCGIYTILMNIREGKMPYILFTENEEVGCIGAGYFADDIDSGVINREDIDINFIIEIDRKNGNDSVYYDCDNPEFEKYISSFGFKTAWGSCSDISYVAPSMGVAAVNLSSGYYDQHTLSETIALGELYNIVTRVRDIIDDVAENGTAKFEYIEAIYKNKYSNWKYDAWNYDYDYYSKEYDNTKKKDDDNFDPLDDTIKHMSEIDFSDGAYIITENGTYICDEDADLYFIDENGKIYLAVDNCAASDGSYDVYIAVPIRGSAFSASNLPYRFDSENTYRVYVNENYL